MSSHDAKSPPPVTYTARPKISGHKLTCKRCKREYPYPSDGVVIRCECGWRYANVGDVIHEEFAPRIGV